MEVVHYFKDLFGTNDDDIQRLPKKIVFFDKKSFTY